MRMSFVVLTVVMVGTAFGQSGQGGMLPPWVNDSWRESQYPAADWYIGYAVDAVTGGAKLSDVQRRAENTARLKLTEGISVRIVGKSLSGTDSKRVSDGKNTSETIKKDYKQEILASTNAEVGKVELTTFYDQTNNKVHALAKVKKADLAAYYVSRIDYYQQNADNDLKLAKQFADSDKKRSAIEKIIDAKKNIGECEKYNDLLSAVDGSATTRLIERGAALLRDITAFETKLNESSSIFVGGREVLGGKNVDIVIPSIQSMLSESGCRVADRREESNFILTVDVSDCMTTQSGSFYYVSACVKANVENVKTGKSDAKLNFTAPKAGWTNEDRAGRKAFEEAATTLWSEIKQKTELCK